MSDENILENSIVQLKTESDGLQVEYEIIPVDPLVTQIDEAVQNLDNRIQNTQTKLDEVDDNIDRLTNHADAIDYSVAVACGILTGLIDVFFVGEFDFVGSREKVGNKFDEIVQKKANELREKEVKEQTDKAIEKAKQAAQEKGKTLSEEEIKKIQEKFSKKLQEPLDKEKSIRFLEERFSIPSDSVYEKFNEEKNNIIKKMVEDAEKNGKPLSESEIKDLKDKIKSKISHDTHHLDDLTHHPSIIGLAASIAQQFGAKAVFQNREGKIIPIEVEKVKIIRRGKETIEIQLIGKDLKSKLVSGVCNWIMHLLSDIAGSSSSAGNGTEGMGLPGPIMSMLKEIAMIPGINKTSLPEKLYELFTKEQDFLGGYKLDLRSELAIGVELGKQAIPVFINTIFVRCFYFIRHFIQEVKANNGFDGLDVKGALKRSMPFKNRTVIRMLTISLGTFEAVDLGDAVVRGAMKSGGTLPGFFAAFIVRVNFVGIGRFAIAVMTDVKMGVEKGRYENKRAILLQDMILALESKMYYKLASVKICESEMYAAEVNLHNTEAMLWKQVDNTAESINALYDQVCKVAKFYEKETLKIDKGLSKIENDVQELRDSNPDLVNELLQHLM